MRTRRKTLRSTMNVFGHNTQHDEDMATLASLENEGELRTFAQLQTSRFCSALMVPVTEKKLEVARQQNILTNKKNELEREKQTKLVKQKEVEAVRARISAVESQSEDLESSLENITGRCNKLNGKASFLVLNMLHCAFSSHFLDCVLHANLCA